MMKKKSNSKHHLSQKVLCTVLAASVFGVCGSVFAEDYVVDSNKTITGEELTGQNVILPDNFKESGYELTVTGQYTIGKLDISGESTVKLNAAGNINNGIYMHSGDELSLTTNNANIKGYVKITGGYAKLTGGSIVSGGYYPMENGNYSQEDIRVNEGSGLETTNVNITGDVMAEDDGSFVNITGGSVNETVYYKVDEKAEDGRHLELDSEGKPIADGYTELHAEIGGKVTVNNAVLNTGVSAFGNNGEVTVNNSSINTKGGIFAAVGGKIYLNGDENTVYSVAEDGYFMALSGEVGNNSGAGSIEINGGTLKAENLRYLVGLENNPFIEGTYQGDEIKLEVVKGGIVLQGSGVIETKGDQIFESGVDVSSDEAVLASTSGAVTNDAISYVGGTLKLTDEKYSLNYVDSAKAALIDYQNDSATKIVMTGTLVTASSNNVIDVEDAASIGNDIELDQVTVNADKNLLVGADLGSSTPTVESIEIKDSVNNGFSAATLNLAEGSTGVVITDGENVTLGGSNGGELITVNSEKATNLKVIVGLDESTTVDGVTEKTGSFTIGNALATSSTEYTLTGSVTVNNGSALNVNGQTTVTDGVTLAGGAVDVTDGVLKSNITASGTSTITGTAEVGTLTGAADAVINVGNVNKAGNVTVETAALDGAVVFLDPAWVDGAEITDASKMAVAGTEGKVTANGKYVVGQNSVMSFGVDNNDKAQEIFAKTGLTWGKDAVTAGLYIAGSVDLNNGAVVVDGDLTQAPATPADGTFTAAANSLVMVDGASTLKEAAISGVTSATVADTSKLYIDGAKKGETYHVIDGVDTDGWADANIISDNALLVFNGDGTSGDNKFDVTAKYQTVASAFGAGAVVIPTVIDETLANQSAGNAAFDFFNDAVNTKTNATKAAQVNALNSIANMGELAGVNHGTYSMSNTMTDAVAHHLSLATHGEQDKDIWAHYIHNKEDVDGMSLGGVDANYDAQFNGIVIGSDLYKNGKTTAGIALSYADGNINGYNGTALSKNDAEYYGATLYGRIENENSAVLGDITYMHSDNDVTQTNSGHEITASADADAFSIGVRAEQAIKAGAGKFVPYAGLRYMHLGAGNYTNSLGMEYNADDQNLWLMPVGVTYSAEIASGDWTLKPIAEVGYVWTMGDRETDQTVYLNGAADSFGFETADSGSFISRFGLEAQNGSMTYGLGYEYQKGDSVKANRWLVNMVYSF